MVCIGRRGTTPVVPFVIEDFDLSSITDLCLVMKQDGKVIIKKNREEVTISGNTISVHLTQEETLRFRAKAWIENQIKFKIDNQVFATDIEWTCIEDALCEEVI